MYYSDPIKLKTSITQYIDRIIRDLQEEITTTTNNLAAGHLFQVGEESRRVLPEEQAV